MSIESLTSQSYGRYLKAKYAPVDRSFPVGHLSSRDPVRGTINVALANGGSANVHSLTPYAPLTGTIATALRISRNGSFYNA